jgi:hypothetical protein
MSKLHVNGRDHSVDADLPGQLTAVVARPPVFGARLTSVDDGAARAIKGVKAVLRIPVDREAKASPLSPTATGAPLPRPRAGPASAPVRTLWSREDDIKGVTTAPYLHRARFLPARVGQ